MGQVGKVALILVILLAGCATRAPTADIHDDMFNTIGSGPESDFISNAGDRVFYDYERFDLTRTAKATLGRQSAWLLRYPFVNVLVAGNADDRGTEAYNLALGTRRADVARDYLVAQGVAASRIKTISYGKDCPVAPGNTEAAYQQNRNAITSVQGANPQNCH